MKGTERFPWFEALTFLLILLLALGSNLATHDPVVAATQNATPQ